MWTWKIAPGHLYRNGQYVATGYSGRGRGLNNVCWQAEPGSNPDDPDAGPIPAGKYRFAAMVDTHGGLAIRLLPFFTNKMYGRSAFMIHGGYKSEQAAEYGWGTASLGCIILDRPIRKQMWYSDDRVLEVVEV